MRYEMKMGLVENRALRAAHLRLGLSALAVASLAAATGCQASFKAGGSEQPSSYNNNPPPRYNNAPRPAPAPYNPAPAPAPYNSGTGNAPRAAPMPGYQGQQSQNNPPPAYYPGSPARYTLPGGDSVPIATSGNAFGNGQATSDSLRGFVYVIPAGSTRLPNLSAMRPIGVLYTRTLDVPQRDFREGFPGIDNGRNDWFAIRYEGTFNVARSAPYSFRLRTDDGSVLYIDDVKQIDNDGLHGAGGGARVVSLNAGMHRIRLDYFQGGLGPLALQVFVAGPNNPEHPFTTTF